MKRILFKNGHEIKITQEEADQIFKTWKKFKGGEEFLVLADEDALEYLFQITEIASIDNGV